MNPTADHIAAAIVAACRLTDEAPERVARGAQSRRARWYAAYAIQAVFPDASRPKIGRWCGAGTPNFLVNCDKQLQADEVLWWDEAAFMAVIRAVEAVRIPPLKAYPIHRKRKPLGAVVNGLMGDPAPHRSALGKR